MSGAERLTRWSTAVAVTAVAGVAGAISYQHALEVVRAHGEAGAVAQAYPITIDGLIYSASMVLLDATRRGVRAPRLARWLLTAGIGATLAANVAAGLHFGPVGAIVAAWPALALVGSYELLMLIIRGAAAQHVEGAENEQHVHDLEPVPGAVPGSFPAPSIPRSAPVPALPPSTLSSRVPDSAESAARAALAASIAAANPLSRNQLVTRFGVSRTVARRIHAECLAARNGHLPQ